MVVIAGQEPPAPALEPAVDLKLGVVELFRGELPIRSAT